MAQLARSRVVLTAELSVGDAALSECRACCQQLADLLREEVSLQVTGAARGRWRALPAAVERADGGCALRLARRRPARLGRDVDELL
jgi:hypothetical protein